LIKYYLDILKTRREDFIRNYQPSHWELLNPAERKTIIDRNLLDQQEELIEAQLRINKFFCLHRERKKAYQLAKMSNLNASMALPKTADLVHNTAFTPEEYSPENDHTENKDLIDWDPKAQSSPNHSHQPLGQKENLTLEARAASNLANPTDLATNNNPTLDSRHPRELPRDPMRWRRTTYK
ncbi:hypothetical protein VP01_5632g1, partial [Puccinia sorghi]